MKADVYKIVLEFYLITKTGPKVNDETKLQSRNILVNGDEMLCGVSSEMKVKARKLADSLLLAYSTLMMWSGCPGNNCLYKSYTAKSKRKPSRGAFDATLEVINTGVTMAQAAKAHKINAMSVKVMKPRIERYISYADRLKKLLT